jgi:hypothetical protein
MQALFIGQTYIDVTFITDHMPTGDEKHVASAYAVSFGGNAVTAAFCCAKLGIVPDLIATVANDWLGRMFQDMSAKYGISIHPRKVNASSLSFIMPKDGKRGDRALPRRRAHPPVPDAQPQGLSCAACRRPSAGRCDPLLPSYAAKDGILTSLDGGGLQHQHPLSCWNSSMSPIVAERLCEQMELTPEKMLDYLRAAGCRVGWRHPGRKGLASGMTRPAAVRAPCRHMPIPRRARDRYRTAPATCSTAPISYSYLGQFRQRLEGPFRVRARGIDLQDQRLGNEAGLPTPARYRGGQAGVSSQAQLAH